ncbi:MAG: NUDIX domain-containing protein [Clostridia bacterium]|nr:NUDIX domain-containing protein [Clostridia bacterium]
MTEAKEIRPGVAVIIFNKKGEVLLQKRADFNLWGIPSGHVEPGETVTDAAVREVLEETGLLVKIVRLIGIYSDPRFQILHYPDGRITHFVTCCFQAEVIGGELKAASPETLELAYFPIDGLPENILKMHPLWLTDALNPMQQPFIR